MKKLAQGFNTAAQDSNPGSRSRESEALLLSHVFKENNVAIKKCSSNETVTWHSTRTVSGDGNDRCYVNKTKMSDRGDRERPFNKYTPMLLSYH